MAAAMEQLLAMGFPEDKVKVVLEACDFDLTRAANALLAPVTAIEEEGVGQQMVVQGSISQYDVENGRSACTCIGLEASLSILEHLSRGAWTAAPKDVTNIVNVGVVMYEALVGAGTLAAEHTSVSEVLAAASRYGDALQAATATGCHQGLLGSDSAVAELLAGVRSERRDHSKHVALAITKPPETVVAFIPPASVGDGSSATSSDAPAQWLLFDSHSRPQIGLTGASIRAFEDERALVEAINITFPALDLGQESLMAEMYNMIDCTPLTLKQQETT